MKRMTMAIAAVLCLVAGACGDDDEGTNLSAEGGGGVSVLASFYPLAEAAQRVGGDAVTVENLTPAGSEPHDLELTPPQVEALEGADVVLTLGRGFQPGVEEVAEGRSGTTVEVLSALDVGEGQVAADDHAEEEGEAHVEEEGEGDHAAEEEDADHADEAGATGGDDHAEEGEGGLDPHVWLDPTKMADVVDEVTAALSEVDPDGAEAFEANAEAYKAELAELDESYELALASCERDVMVVAHDAFGWLADRYGLVQEPIAGLSPDQEPDPQRLAELVGYVEEEGVTTVFTETLVSPDVAETLAREAGVETAVLNPIEGLTDEQLADGETYLTVMEDNLATLEAALGCS